MEKKSCTRYNVPITITYQCGMGAWILGYIQVDFIHLDFIYVDNIQVDLIQADIIQVDFIQAH